MIFLVPLLIILSCYVSVAEMSEDCKSMYFVVVGGILALVVVFNLIL